MLHTCFGWLLLGLLMAVVTAGTTAFAARNDDKAAIKSLAGQWCPVLEKGDTPAIMAFFTDDVVIAGWDPQSSRVGRAEMEKLVTDLFEQNSATNTSLKVSGISVDGDWAELRGVFAADWKSKANGAITERERTHYVWVLRRQSDGAWKVARFLFYPRAKA